MTSALRRHLAGLLLVALALSACGRASDHVTSRQSPGEAQPADAAPEPAGAPTAGTHPPAAPSPATSGGSTGAPARAPASPSVTPAPEPTTPVEPTTAHGHAVPPPPWLGTRILAPGPEGYAPAQPTPPELRDRRLVTADLLPPPPDGAFMSSVSEVPDDVAARSTWAEGCPVALSDLRYVTVAFWGFDDRAHTGELLVHERAADDLVAVFARMFEARFPIEEMRITRPDELDAPPTGDGNNTGAFVCRPSRGSQRWSEHAFGLAVDVNPFHNPLVRGETILPELATAYADRTWERPGMIRAGDVVVAAFDEIGWSWGGSWTSLVDHMHFSHNGR